MTLRLVLIVLVVALGFSIPKWPDSQLRSGADISQAAPLVKTRGPRSVVGTFGGAVVNGRLASSTVSGNVLGADSQVVRPTARSTSNFWRVPSGVHAGAPVAVSAPLRGAAPVAVASKEVAELLVVAQADNDLATRSNRTNSDVDDAIQGPPAQLKLKSLPAKTAFAVATVDANITRYLENANNLWTLQGQDRSTTTARLRTPSLSIILRPFYQGLASISSNLVDQVRGTARTATTLSTTIASAVRARLDVKSKVVTIASVSTHESKALPVTVFAASPVPVEPKASESVAQLNQLPSDVFAPAPAPVLAAVKAVVVEERMLPADVFAPAPVLPVVAVVKPVVVEERTLPADVFAPTPAPVVAVAKAVVVEERTLPTDVFAPAPAPVMAVVKPVVVEERMLPADVFAPAAAPVVAVVAEERVVPMDVFAPAPAPVVAMAEPVVAEELVLPADVIAPAEVVNEVAASDSFQTPETETRSPERLSDAVNLTRDAAVAWIKVFSGPAVVSLRR